jgi:hypothetical protein
MRLVKASPGTSIDEDAISTLRRTEAANAHWIAYLEAQRQRLTAELAECRTQLGELDTQIKEEERAGAELVTAAAAWVQEIQHDLHDNSARISREASDVERASNDVLHLVEALVATIHGSGRAVLPPESEAPHVREDARDVRASSPASNVSSGLGSMPAKAPGFVRERVAAGSQTLGTPADEAPRPSLVRRIIDFVFPE